VAKDVHIYGSLTVDSYRIQSGDSRFVVKAEDQKFRGIR
jgi:hypothetical protein